jgi:hypothetical protein
MTRVSVLALAVALVASVGCGVTSVTMAEGFKQRAPANPSVLVMAPDVELYELTAGGALEPKADWTEQAEEHVSKSLVEELRGKQLALVPYAAPPQGSKKEHDDLQLVRLHGAVAKSILIHHYSGRAPLPAKKGKFDWGMGAGVQRLRGDTKADYILFIVMRDSYASGGRVALATLSAIFGGNVSGGEQAGFASLVDLSSGEVVWCNLLYRRSGDLRTPEPARQAVRYLLEGFPW